jgi:acetyltransferase-like isoleucine patch superfamily enzyme
MAFTHLRTVDGKRVIEGDWYPGTIPEGVHVHAQAYVGSSYSFLRFCGQRADAVVISRGATLADDSSLDIGPNGKVRLGEFATVNGARLICDAEIEIGPYAMLAWDVVLMDSYRSAHEPVARPIRLGSNCWIGFAACVLPGVTVGEGSIVQARSVVVQDVPANVIVAGNPARIIRSFKV